MGTSVPTDTRDLIVGAAERLFAERGIHGVSLREINRLAGQSNTGAVQYHFGDREGLVRAVVAKHRRDTGPRRHALLDLYEDGGRDDVRVLAAALVAPIAAKLSDPDGGRAYIRITAELCSRSRLPALDGSLAADDSIDRWLALAESVAPVGGPAALGTHGAAIRFAFVELARRAASDPRDDDRVHTSHLTDLVAALLSTPPSPVTLRQLGPTARPTAVPG